MHRTIQESGWTRVDKATAQTFHHQQVSPISLLAPAGALYVMMHGTVGQEGSQLVCFRTAQCNSALLCL